MIRRRGVDGDSLGPARQPDRRALAAVTGNSRLLWVAGLGGLLWLTGCAGPVETASRPSLAVVADAPLIIPAHRAHAAFQDGRQVGAVSRFEPWCELEIKTVSEQPQRVDAGRFPVRRVSQAFIRDYNTRAPALLGGLSCTDLVFQETIWWLEGQPAAPVTWLRCLAPYTHCRFGPPLSLAQMQAVVGSAMRIEIGDPAL